MISVDRITSFAETRLKLNVNKEYNRGSAYHSLGDVLLDLRMRVPEIEKSVDITTVAEQSEYNLEHAINHILAIDTPSTWDDEELIPVGRAKLMEIRRALSNSETDYSTVQPNWYAFWQQSGGKNGVIAFERADSIVADLTVTIHYYPLVWEQPERETDIDMPQDQELLLKYGLTWKLAEIHAFDKVGYYQGEYEKHLAIWKETQAFTDTAHTHTRDFLEF